MDDNYIVEHRPKGIVVLSTIYFLTGLFVFFKSLLDFFIVEFGNTTFSFGGKSFIIWILLSFVLCGLSFFVSKGYKFSRIVGICIHSLLIAVGTAILTSNAFGGTVIVILNTIGIWYLAINEDVKDFFGV